MKTFLSLLFVAASTVSTSAHAFGLESFYGRTTQRGHTYTCTYENTTGGSQSMKYVVFNFDPISGDGASHDVQVRIDKVVNSDATIRASAEHSLNARVNYCKFLARR